MAEHEDELVSVALIREDLRYLLVAASNYLDELRERGEHDPKLDRAIYRIGSTASMAEWQPKPRREDAPPPDEES
jgi:hypothetical protein